MRAKLECVFNTARFAFVLRQAAARAAVGGHGHDAASSGVVAKAKHRPALLHAQMITREHFELALGRVKPSVSQRDQKHYEQMQKKFG